jgi:hypothetical protein
MIGERIGDVVGAGAVELGGHGHAQHAELAHAGEGLAREARDAVAFGGRRRQFAWRELAGHVADLRWPSVSMPQARVARMAGIG